MDIGEINSSIKQLQMVCLQLYDSKLSFSVYGFFALDKTLLQKVSRNTYCV